MSKRSPEYWADRLSRQNQKIGDKTVDELEERLRQYYRAASADITKEAEALYNRLLAQAGDQPVRPNDLYRLDRMYHLQSKIHTRLKELGGEEIELFGGKLRELAELVDKNTVSGLPDAARNSPWAVLPPEQAEAIANRIWCADGENWSDRIWKNKAALQQRLEKGMVDGIIRGAKTGELTKALMEDFGVGYREASRIARTETAHVQAEAEAAALEREGYSRYRFVNATDGRTCGECGRLNGKTFAMSERRAGVNFPPIHPNCRGRIVAVVTFADGTEVKPVIRGPGHWKMDKSYRKEVTIQLEEPARFEGDITDKFKQRFKETVAGGQVAKLDALPAELRDPFSSGLKKADLQVQAALSSILPEVDFHLTENRNSQYLRGVDVVEVNREAKPSTVAHELFHRLDDKNGISKAGELQKALNRDFRRLKAESGENLVGYLMEQYPNIWRQTQKGKWILKEEYRGISDILSGLTDGELNLGYHHSADYWKRSKYSLSREAWAQFGRILYENNPEAVRLLKTLFPKFYERATMALKELI